MTSELPDGTIIPSFLGLKTSGIAHNTGMQTNLALRVGEVRQIIYPDDDMSVSGTFIEYNVFVQHQDGGKPGIGMFYNNCLLFNAFGGVADKVRYTLRPSDVQQDTQKLVGNGSKVLLLCVNGTTHNAFILGGIRTPVGDPGNESADDKSDGHNYYFEFNGAQFTVNDDGELQLKFRGKTNADDTLADGANSDAEGSTLLFSKDGSITSTSPDGNQSIKINHDNHKLEVTGDQEIDVTCSSGQVNIQSTGVKVGAATDKWPLFSTYREAETEMNTQVSAADDSLASIHASAGALIILAGALNIIPMVGGILAAVPFASAGALLISAGSAFGEQGAAIDEFEAQAEEYLSLKNTND